MRVVGGVGVTTGFFLSSFFFFLLLLSGQVMYWLRQESVRGMPPRAPPIWVPIVAVALRYSCLSIPICKRSFYMVLYLDVGQYPWM